MNSDSMKFHLPKQEEVFGWVEDMYALGPRRPGTAADRKCEDYLVKKLKELGLKNVRKEAILIRVWEANKYELRVGEALDAVKPAPAFYIPYTAFTPAKGVEAELVYGAPEDVGKAESRKWKGRVVVADINFPDLDFKMLKKLSYFAYDPDGDIEESQHAATWVRLHWNIYQEAARRGAAGFIGILADHYPGGQNYYAPYGFKEKDIHDKPIPGFWVDCVEGERVRKLAKSGRGCAKLTLTGTLADGPTHNVIGEIPGESDEFMMIASHHDSPFDSGVEDASGCAAVLAAASHLVKSKTKLKRTVLVSFTAGHFYGSVGTRAFIKSAQESGQIKKMAFEFHVEHIAKEAKMVGADMQVLKRAEPSAIFLSFNRKLVKSTLAALEAEELTRVVALPAEGPLGKYPPTDGGDFHSTGVPIANLISGPVYLLNSEDTIDKVNVGRLLPTARAVIRVLTDMDAIPMRRLKVNHYPFKTALMRILQQVMEKKAGASTGIGH